MAAARPVPAEARVPCPLCGGAIHPIAGRCKHCKADLAHRQPARPASATPLPSLQGGASTATRSPYAPGPASPYAAPSSTPYSVAHGAPAQHVQHAPSLATSSHASAPIAHAAPSIALPPAATTVLPSAAPVEDARVSTWRSWPVIVIALAMAAIVVAVVLMVWPTTPRDAGKRSLGAEPAPERMQTQPELAPRPAPSRPAPPRDPWADPPSAAPDPRPAPNAAPAPADPSAADDTPDTDDDTIDNLPTPRARTGRAQLQGRGTVMLAMVEHMCRKLAQCGGSSPSVSAMCASLRRGAVPPASCPSASRCLAHIDTLPCDSAGDSDVNLLTTLMTQFQDCAEAMQC